MILEILQNGGEGGTPRQLKVNSSGPENRNMATTTGPLCQHQMDNATRCRCPAMRGKRYCYSHRRQHKQGARKNAERGRQRWFESVPLDNATSVQRALGQVMQRLLSGQVDHKKAGQILYKLQTASVNLRPSNKNSVSAAFGAAGEPHPGPDICPEIDLHS